MSIANVPVLARFVHTSPIDSHQSGPNPKALWVCIYHVRLMSATLNQNVLSSLNCADASQFTHVLHIQQCHPEYCACCCGKKLKLLQTCETMLPTCGACLFTGAWALHPSQKYVDHTLRLDVIPSLKGCKLQSSERTTASPVRQCRGKTSHTRLLCCVTGRSQAWTHSANREAVGKLMKM
jgi:hypothetical protein